MLSNPSKFLSKITLKEFISDLKSGNREFFKLRAATAYEGPVFNLDKDPSAGGGTQYGIRDSCFNVFDNNLVREDDNGDVRFVFYTTTSNVDRILDTAAILFSELGNGIVDPERFTPFTNQQKVREIATGRIFTDKDEMVHLWLYEDLVFLLQYCVNPLRQFALMITQKAPKNIYSSIRRKGSILDLLGFNLDNLMNAQPLHANESWRDNQLRFVDYVYRLPKNELNAFDIVAIRILGKNRVFDPEIQTQVTLYSYDAIPPERKIYSMERLIQLYGTDSSGRGDLESCEVESLWQGRLWAPRSWDFNDRLGILHKDSNEEPWCTVSVNDKEDEQGFKLHIGYYNRLVKFFGAE